MGIALNRQAKEISIAGSVGEDQGARARWRGLSASGERRSVSITVAWGVIREWRRHSRSRKELRTLSRLEIQDFCLNSVGAKAEICKSFWRP